MRIIKGLLFVSTLTLAVGCTNLNEQVLDGVKTSGGADGAVNTAALLAKTYEGLRDFNGQGGQYALDEMSTDAMVGPTRGGDWDDNAVWRQIHTQTWGPDHNEVKNAWNSLLSNAYNCSVIIENGGTAPQIAQARFLRAFYYYNVIDLFGQAPYRPAGSKIEEDPKVWTRTEATKFCIDELEAVVSSLPARVTNDASIANKDAAHFLLAKLYLNKAVFESADPSGAITFAAADMTKVVQNVDAMTNTLASSYWKNFAPDNNTSNEIVFSSLNIQGGAGGGMQSKWRMCQHYNQTPGGWNGFSTIAEYYSRFGDGDGRKNYSTPQFITDFGNPAGFQKGQQYAPGGVTPLEDRNGHPLVFTAAITLITSGATLETAGIRAEKYIPDNENINSPDNDLVLMRYADALLMKAEAIARGGAGTVGTIMSDIATRAGVAAAPATLDGIYAERGRELWWEGWRRNDMIRFGKFLAARELKPYVSDKRYVLFPIPADALFNANLSQNAGY